jgi:hypothetical protein
MPFLVYLFNPWIKCFILKVCFSFRISNSLRHSLYLSMNYKLSRLKSELLLSVGFSLSESFSSLSPSEHEGIKYFLTNVLKSKVTCRMFNISSRKFLDLVSRRHSLIILDINSSWMVTRLSMSVMPNPKAVSLFYDSSISFN